MLKRLENIEPQQALGILILAPIIAIASMDWRFVIPFGLITIIVGIATLYKLFTSWKWTKAFIAYTFAGAIGITFFIVWGSIILLLIILAVMLFISMPD